MYTSVPNWVYVLITQNTNNNARSQQDYIFSCNNSSIEFDRAESKHSFQPSPFKMKHSIHSAVYPPSSTTVGTNIPHLLHTLWKKKKCRSQCKFSYCHHLQQWCQRSEAWSLEAGTSRSQQQPVIIRTGVAEIILEMAGRWLVIKEAQQSKLLTTTPPYLLYIIYYILCHACILSG